MNQVTEQCLVNGLGKKAILMPHKIREQSSKRCHSSACTCSNVFVFSRAQGSITSTLFSEVSISDKYFIQTDPSVRYFSVDNISHNSTFLKAKPNATFRLAAHLTLSNIITKVSINRFGVRESIVLSKALCLLFYISKSARNLHISISSGKVSLSTSPSICLTSVLFAPYLFFVPWIFRLCNRKDYKLGKSWRHSQHLRKFFYWVVLASWQNVSFGSCQETLTFGIIECSSSTSLHVP